MKSRLETQAFSAACSSILLALCLSLTVILSPCTLRADPYDKLLRSKEMQDFDKRSAKMRASSTYKQGDLDPHSNLALALMGKVRERILLVWVEGRLMGFLRMDEFADRKERYVINQGSYKDQQTGQMIVLQILLPFPRFAMQADMGFIEAMAALQPPALKTTSSEEVNFGRQRGHLYHEEDGACSVAIKLPKGALLSARAEKCGSDKRLKSFVNMLNLDRLERKLNS